MRGLFLLRSCSLEDEDGEDDVDVLGSAIEGMEVDEVGLGARTFLFLLAMPRELGIMPSLSGLGPGSAPSLSPALL